jgi:hypothetical protein
MTQSGSIASLPTASTPLSGSELAVLDQPFSPSPSGFRTVNIPVNVLFSQPVFKSLIAVATPSNANAASAGVAVGQLYRGTADPAIVYVRTA